MFNPISEADARATLGVSRQNFQRSIRPHMIEAGCCVDISEDGSQPRYAYDGNSLAYWRFYIAVRQHRIERGVWQKNRPFSLEDFRMIASYRIIDILSYAEKNGISVPDAIVEIEACGGKFCRYSEDGYEEYEI